MTGSIDGVVKSKKLKVKSEKTIISETFRGEKLKVKSGKTDSSKTLIDLL